MAAEISVTATITVNSLYNILVLLINIAPKTDIATRALIITLKSPLVRMTTVQIATRTGLSARTIDNIYARACQREFDPNHEPFEIRDEWIQDAPHSGWPSKQTPEVVNTITEKVRRDRFGQEKTCADLASILSQEGYDISAAIVWRILKKAGFNKTKPTRKPKLTKQIKKEKLK